MHYNNYRYSLPVLSGYFEKDKEITQLDYDFIASVIEPVKTCFVEYLGYRKEVWVVINSNKKFKITTVKMLTEGDFYKYSWTSWGM